MQTRITHVEHREGAARALKVEGALTLEDAELTLERIVVECTETPVSHRVHGGLTEDTEKTNCLLRVLCESSVPSVLK